VTVAFGGSSYPLATPVFVAAYVSAPLNRDEFRTLCDRHRTKAAILHAMQSLRVGSRFGWVSGDETGANGEFTVETSTCADPTVPSNARVAPARCRL
jgi:hypothetical protein